MCLPPEDVVPTSAPRAQPEWSDPALPRPEEVIGNLCGMNRAALTVTAPGPSQRFSQRGVRRHYEHPLLKWTARQGSPRLLLRVAGLWPLLDGPRCCGFLDSYIKYWSFCYFYLQIKETTALFSDALAHCRFLVISPVSKKGPVSKT